MKKLPNTLSELSTEAPPQIFNALKKAVSGYELSDEELADNSLEELFGGGVYLVETSEDLKSIGTPLETTLKNADGSVDMSLGGWASIAETASSFDVCEWLPDASFVMVLLCTNNAGGSTYFIPASIAAINSNVLMSITLTMAAWATPSVE